MPLPNAWTFEGVTGLTVDADDVVWVLQRPNDFDNDATENYASLNPPTALCCRKPPTVMAFDPEGNLVHHWNTHQGHMIMVDGEERVWVGSDTFRMYSKEGDLLEEFGNRAPEGIGEAVGEEHDPGSPFLVGRVEGAALDEDAREIFIVDSYLEGRVVVYGMDPPYEFKRGWGAYGKPLKDISTTHRDPYRYDPAAPPPEDFVGHVTIGIADDGEVYVADRVADRIQVFTKQGEFLREFWVAPETLDRGSTGGIAFTQDPGQRYLLVPDVMNNVVWIVERKTGETLSRVGFFGRSGGGFHWLHVAATDSYGNLFTGEVDTGKRIQKFELIN
jgi:hypothetical protein